MVEIYASMVPLLFGDFWRIVLIIVKNHITEDAELSNNHWYLTVQNYGIMGILWGVYGLVQRIPPPKKKDCMPSAKCSQFGSQKSIWNNLQPIFTHFQGKPIGLLDQFEPLSNRDGRPPNTKRESCFPPTQKKQWPIIWLIWIHICTYTFPLITCKNVFSCMHPLVIKHGLLEFPQIPAGHGWLPKVNMINQKNNQPITLCVSGQGIAYDLPRYKPPLIMSHMGCPQMGVLQNGWFMRENPIVRNGWFI